MRLKRYLNHEIRLAMTGVVGILMLIFTSQQFVRFLGDTVDGKISAEILLFMVGLQIPPLLGFLLPLGLFLGVLLAFGRMYVDHELVVAHSIGVGNRQLAAMLLPSVFGIALVAGVFSLWVAPWAASKQQDALKQQDGKSELQLLTPGKFQVSRDGSSVMYVAESTQEGAMEQVFFAQLPQMAEEEPLSDSPTPNTQNVNSGKSHRGEGNHSKSRDGEHLAQWRLITAQRGFQRSHQGVEASDSNQQQKSTTERFLVLSDGASYTIPLESRNWEITSFAEYSMKINQNTSSARKLKVKSVPTLELFDNPTAEHWAEIHWRLSVPLSIPLLALLAVPLARVQPRQGKFAKMLPALALYMVYIVLILGARGMIEDEKVSHFWGMWWVHGLLIIYLCYLYRPSKAERTAGKPTNQAVVE